MYNDNMGYPPVYDTSPVMMGRPVVGVIAIESGIGGTMCPVCGHVGPSIPRYRMGCASWCWCCLLFWSTYILWLIPVCSNGCKDIEQLCDRCGAVKAVIEAQCC